MRTHYGDVIPVQAMGDAVFAISQGVNHSVCVLFSSRSKYDDLKVVTHFLQELGQPWPLLESDGSILRSLRLILDR